MFPAVLFGGVLWGISGFPTIAFAAFSVIFAGLVAIYLYA
jgi:hypothetical protein